jgi:glucose-6-phosphate 1-epimerase
LPEFQFGNLKAYLKVIFNILHIDSQDQIQVSFGLDQTLIPDSFRDKWGYDFALQYMITLTPTTLQTDFRVDNSGSKEFSFTCLLHTYFSVDINSTKIEGLNQIGYKDSLLKASFIESNKELKIQQEVDRVYERVPPEILLSDSEKSLVIRKEGFEDVVVWNPWIEKSKAMADFDDSEYLSMVCVEVGSVANAITLKPGQSWSGSQILSCV